MQDFFIAQQDYILAAFALALMAIGALSWRLRTLERFVPRLPWGWFATFAVLSCLAQFVEVVQLGFGGRTTLRVASFVLTTLACLALLEFDFQAAFPVSRRAIGRLITLPLVGIVALASALGGWNGLFAGICYGLVLPPGLWAAWLIWVRTEQVWEGNPRDESRWRQAAVTALHAVAGTFAVLIILVGAVPPFIPNNITIFPASILNAVTFFSRTGIPIDLLRAVAGLAMVSLIWLFIIYVTQEEERDQDVTQRLPDRRWPIILGMAVLLLGWALTDYLGDIALDSLQSEQQQLCNSLAAQLKLESTKTCGAVVALSHTDEVKHVLATGALNDNRKAVTVLDWYAHTYDLSGCYVVDTRGRTIASSTGSQVKPLDPVQLQERTFFQQALRGEIGEDYLRGSKINDRALYVGYPVTDFQNQVLGVAVIKRSLRYIDTLFQPLKLAFLIAPNRKVFLSNHLEMLDLPFDKPLLPQGGEQAEKPSVTPGQVNESIPLGGQTVGYVHSKINDAGWEVALLVPQQQVYTMRLIGMGIVVVFLMLTFSLTQGYETRQVTAARIAASEKRYRSLTEGLPNAVFLLDREGRFLAANQVGREALGLTTEALLARTFPEIWPAAARPGMMELLKLVAGGGRWSREEMMPAHKVAADTVAAEDGGPPVIWQVVLSPILNADGSVDRIHALMIDITDRKRAEEAFSAEKERLAVTLLSIGDGVITTDSAGTVVLMNKVAEDLTGWPMAEAQGHPLHHILDLFNEQTGMPVANPATRILTGGSDGASPSHVALPGGPCVLKARDEREHLVEARGAPIIGQEGQVVGVVIVFRDVEEEVRWESEMMRWEKLESVGVLAGGIAHDFNNLLVAIMGSVSLALRRPEDAGEVIRHLGNAEKALGRASALTQQLLTFAKGGEPIRSAAAIGEILAESLDFAVRGSNVSTKIHIATDIWLVDADAGQIGRVVHNLVINAVQAMPQGGTVALQARNVVIDGTQSPALDPGPYVEVAVSDTGVGIAEGDLEHIFVPYFSTKEQGSGLGLAIAYSVIKKHRGHLTVHSRVGRGTTFTFYLPALPDASEGARDLGLGTGDSGLGRGRVLIMDDDQQVREVIQEMAESLGYEAEGTRNGGEAVARYRDAMKAGQPFDVVILDLVIPGGMGGEETIRALRTLDPQVKGVVSSGYSTDPIMSEYQEHGFAGVIAKPFRLEDLGAVLERLIRGEK